MSKLGNILKDTATNAAKSASTPKSLNSLGSGTQGQEIPETTLDEIVVTGIRPAQQGPGFSLSTFMTEINNESILSSARHLMWFTLPKGLLEVYDPNDVRSIILRCEASSLPGITFAESEEIRRYGIGPGDKQPYLPVFGPIATSYIVDGEGVIHSFFYDWLSYVIGFDSSQGMLSQNGFGHNAYEVSYKEDYVSQAKVYVYNEQNKKIIEVTLHNAYPIALDAVPVSWASTDDFMRINVTWDYTDWSARYHNVGEGTSDGAQGLARDINNTIVKGMNKFGLLTGSIGGATFGSLLNGSNSQRLNDIKNIVEVGKSRLVDSIRKRIGF